MPKYELKILNIGFDTVQVEGNSYDEAVNNYLDGKYVQTGPSGVIGGYYGSGIFLDTLRTLGVSEETIERIIVEHNDDDCNQHKFWSGVASIKEVGK
jgi:hypothetical protein